MLKEKLWFKSLLMTILIFFGWGIIGGTAALIVWLTSVAPAIGAILIGILPFLIVWWTTYVIMSDERSNRGSRD